MEVFKKMENIKMLIMDVDGVLTDTRLFLDSDGEWKRFFSIRDGVGIKELQKRGYKTAVITGSKTKDITLRMKNLGIDYFYDGYSDKGPAFQLLIKESGLQPEEMAYIGDDIYDIPLLQKVAFAATVPEAVVPVFKCVDYVTKRSGGLGAVRELCDLLMDHGFYRNGVSG